MKTKLFAATQPIALTLNANSPRGGSKVEITWSDLERCEPTDSWSVSDGGELFTQSLTATVTYRGRDLIVIAVCEDYKTEDTKETSMEIHHFRLSPGRCLVHDEGSRQT